MTATVNRSARSLLAAKGRLHVLGVLEVRDERRAHLDEQRLELRVLRVRDQHLVDGVEHLLVVRDLVIDVGLVEGRALAASSASRRSSSPPDFRLWLVALSSGVTFSRVTSSTACLFTPVWSVTICCANVFTSAFVVVDAASLPASISTWLAVTTIDAICASLRALRRIAPRRAASAKAAANSYIFIERLLDAKLGSASH